ncbi:MAG: chromate transporter [Bacillota bacterium]
MLSLLLSLYWTFTKIGLFTIGGGYAMIPLMEAEIINRQGWLTASEFLDILAVAEMTPGPVSINTATFVGYRLAGIGGSLLATLGVITPSLLLLLLLGRYLQKLIRDPRAERFLKGLRPALIALIMLAAYNLGRAALVDWTTIIIAAALFSASVLRKVNPFYLIGAGALLGLLFFPY